MLFAAIIQRRRKLATGGGETLPETPPEGETWLLSNDTWSDTGVWDDTQQWTTNITAADQRVTLNGWLSDQDLIETRLQALGV